MNRKSFTLICIFSIALQIICTSLLYSQHFKVITGKVKDASTGRAVPYVSVNLSGSTISNITNSEGVFTLKVPDDIQHGDSVIISTIGYKTAMRSINEFTAEKTTEIRLMPSELLINSVLVRPNDAVLLFNMAFTKVKENYPCEKQGLTGFYREIIKKGNRYITLNEAILDIQKASYISVNKDDISIFKGRGNQNIKTEDTLFFKLQGGAVSAINLDVMKSPFIGVNYMQVHDFYDFQMGPSAVIDGKEVYTILFDQKKAYQGILYRGKIYLDNQSLAVTRIEFSMNVEGRNEAWREFVKKISPNVNLEVMYANYRIDYKQYGDRWYYNYGRMDLGFRAKYKGKWIKNKFFITCELAITDTENEKAFTTNPQHKIRFKDIMSAKVNDFTDDNFWGNYNIIEPDESIENVIRRIVRLLKRSDNP